MATNHSHSPRDDDTRYEPMPTTLDDLAGPGVCAPQLHLPNSVPVDRLKGTSMFHWNTCTLFYLKPALHLGSL